MAATVTTVVDVNHGRHLLYSVFSIYCLNRVTDSSGRVSADYYCITISYTDPQQVNYMAAMVLKLSASSRTVSEQGARHGTFNICLFPLAALGGSQCCSGRPCDGVPV